ncbi:hypothetical protein E2C01_005872 [Portunus trituberculatus]|uniref:Reverse transcriptase domain-containing protein n=1 Tax=Portunus trituberculatus TaxID=210409 RepID=A0A5B7CWD4_PORTR|nr:hypothetical protein [Portunus trituberculatus]
MELQKDTDKIWEWSQKWKLEFKTRKCHVMEMGKSNRRPMWVYKIGEEIIMKKGEEKDLGVIIQDTLTPERHINGLFASTYKILTNIRVVFTYMDKSYDKI